ncbi:preprotein translocase subunit SecY [Candidatus Woesearchaeota archaeon]|nr:preprotein translocase subunit SecY [Candidatus Woesearchaeota archaeon]
MEKSCSLKKRVINQKMSLYNLYNTIISNLPEVVKPTEKRLSFREKLKWTAIILVLFFALGLIPIYGLGPNQLAQFEFLSIILGAEFGSIVSLGIGPIVTASILLQLLNGAGLLKFDLTTSEGKRSFQGTQKLLAIVFVVFEAAVYVLTGGLGPKPGVSPFVIMFQLFLGGIIILFMDEVVSKWGFGSGISLFIAAGVSKTVVVRLISPLTTSGAMYLSTGEAPVGAIPAIVYFLQQGNLQEVMGAIIAIAATVLIFIIAVYAQSMKVEVPLSFGRIRGHGVRWPLAFIYTSNIPVILVAALLANIQLFARLLQNAGYPVLGTFAGSSADTGFVAWVQPPQLTTLAIQGNLGFIDVAHSLTYALFMVGGSVLFSIFWVKTAGMDSGTLARQMMSSGLQIPGFRRDERVLESILDRYIMPLTVMGAITVGVLAAAADISGALTSGTGLLLTVMIVYKLYEDIAKQHAMDMNPVLRKFMGE